VSSDNVVANYWAAEFGNLQTYPNWISAENEWCAVTIPWGVMALNVVGAPNRAAINSIWLKLVDQNNKVVTVLFGGVEAIPEPANGVVSITFDDGLITQWTNARPKLDQYRFKATAYIIRDVIDSNYLNGDGTGVMTLQNLRDLQDKHEWEIAAHADTVAHHNDLPNGFVDLGVDSCAWEMSNIKKWLISNGFNAADHLAYPRGLHDLTTTTVAKNFFKSARTTWHPTRSETYPPADAQKLRIFYVLKTTTVASIQTAIDRAVTNKEWLILVFHDITAVANGTTQFTITNFGTVIDYIATQGLAVRPVGDVVENGI